MARFSWAAAGLPVAILAGLMLSACASRNDLVVVLPESNGHVGAVVVQAGDSHTLLNSAYAAAAPGAGGTMKPVTVKPDDVKQIFAGALAAQPIAPKSYTLYFQSGSDTLVPESKAGFEDVFAEISRRKAAEIVVTGHTDTMGAGSFNDSLSLERAKAVAKLFVARGVPADSVTSAGRGERDLLVQTADQVPEPRNRRVVITVR